LCRQRNEHEKKIEEDWYIEQLKQQRLLNAAAMDEEYMRKSLSNDMYSTLDEQVLEKRKKEEDEKAERFRRANGDFYKNFGTSCR
jgi:hypothetical protein